MKKPPRYRFASVLSILLLGSLALRVVSGPVPFAGDLMSLIILPFLLVRFGSLLKGEELRGIVHVLYGAVFAGVAAGLVVFIQHDLLLFAFGSGLESIARAIIRFSVWNLTLLLFVTAGVVFAEGILFFLFSWGLLLRRAIVEAAVKVTAVCLLAFGIGCVACGVSLLILAFEVAARRGAAGATLFAALPSLATSDLPFYCTAFRELALMSVLISLPFAFLMGNRKTPAAEGSRGWAKSVLYRVRKAFVRPSA